jgi:hypothetical protein
VSTSLVEEDMSMRTHEDRTSEVSPLLVLVVLTALAVLPLACSQETGKQPAAGAESPQTRADKVETEPSQKEARIEGFEQRDAGLESPFLTQSTADASPGALTRYLAKRGRGESRIGGPGHGPDATLQQTKQELQQNAGPGAPLLEVRSQILEGDVLSARATLEDHERTHPVDCQLRAWLIWLDIDQYQWEDARLRLRAAGCPQTEEERGRWALLEVLLARSEGDAEGLVRRLQGLGERSALFPEDQELDSTLRWRHLEGYTFPLETTVEVGLGGTSNAFAISPVDAARRDALASMVVRPSIAFQLRAPERRVTPAVEARAWALGIATPEARSRSNATISLRAGAWLGRRPRLRPLFAFAHEEVLLNLPDRSRYAAANRLEAELNCGRRLTLLAGVGRRTFFTDAWRTRREGDGAAILGLSAFGRPLLLAGAFRLFSADRAVHDQVGATLTAATDVPVRPGLSARLVAAAGFDDFPRSGGVDGIIAFGTPDRRRDLLVRISAGLWRRLSDNVVAGATYDFARRWSTADTPGVRFYPFVDHRVLVALRFERGGNPWRQPGREAPGHVPLPYDDLERPSVVLDDLVRRLLRQQDELSEDCGCVLP